MGLAELAESGGDAALAADAYEHLVRGTNHALQECAGLPLSSIRAHEGAPCR